MMSEKPDLDSLGARIRAAQKTREPQATGEEVSSSSIAVAWRISIELVAGVVVGGVAGYYLDKWLEISPVGLMLGIALGALAGFRNMVRSINRP